MPISLFDVLLRLAQLAILATMLGAAAASGVAPGRKRIVFVGVAVVAYALLVALWRAWRNLIAFPCDEFGPTAEDPERLREHFDKVAKANRNLVARWRVQGRLRDQLSRAREATEVERAEAAMEKAQAELEMWRGKYRVPGRERRALERRFRDEWEALRTLKYVHAAQAQMEHAHGLKTERGRDRARGRAQDVLSKGLNDSGADQELLLRFGRESGLLREDASEPAPQLTLAEVEARWVSDQETVEVGGRSLRGPLWLGAHLPGKVEEPSLIDPQLPVSSRASGRTALAGSLSYAQLSGAQRAAFLDWIAQGRASEAPSTFLRLELCAVERRLVEGEASSTELRRDVPGLLALLERRVREGEERPLVEWARSLSRYASLRFPFEVGAQEGPPAPLGAGEMSVGLRLGLARFVSAGQPLPAAWARAWLGAAAGVTLRTAAQRAPDDFERLFNLRYRDRYGAGLVATVGPAPLRAVHRTRSPVFQGRSFQAGVDLPDPESCPAIARELDALADACCEELAGLSRYLGRSPGRAPDLKVLATLPRALLAWHDEPALEDLRATLERSAAGAPPHWVSTRSLTALWPKRGPLGRADCVRFASLLGKLGTGIEPDPRFGAPPWPNAGKVVLFPLASDAPRSPSRAYEAAALVVHVAVALAAADRAGEDALVGAEEEALREHLETSLDLPSAERRRFEMHLAWLRQHPPRLGGLRRQVEGLDQAGRDRLADFLLRIACADGRVTPPEVRMLERAYALLGRDATQVHTDLHRVSSGRPTRRAQEQDEPGAGLALDPARLAQKLAETKRVSALLGDVFQEEEERAADAAVPAAAQGPTFGGLDADHSALLAALAEREEWPRGEVEELAEGLDLMTDGALDTLNDATLEALGDPLWEGEDPLWVDTALAHELMGAG